MLIVISIRPLVPKGFEGERMTFKNRVLVTLTIIIASIFMAFMMAASDNILLSPGFEETPPGEKPTFPPWWEWFDTNMERSSATGGEVTDETYHSGKHSVARYVKGKALGCYANTIEVTPDDIVEGGIWIRTSKDFSGAEAYLRIEFKSEDNKIIQAVESKKILSPDESWKLYTVETSTVPDKASTAVFCLFLRGRDENSVGKAWFDDAYMRVKIKGLI